MPINEDHNSNAQLAFLLRSVAAGYLLKNANRFKVIAYEKAADAIEHLTRELTDIWEENPQSKVPGIGTSIQTHLQEYIKTGKSGHFDEVFAGIPPSVFILMKVPNIGPKTAFKLAQELNLTNEENILSDIRAAALNGSIAKIPSFGQKSQQEILQAIDIYQNNHSQKERIPLGKIIHVVHELIQYLNKHPAVERVDILGSFRRQVTTIGDVDISVAATRDQVEAVINHFIKYPGTLKIDNAGDKKASIIVTPNLRVDLRVQDIETYGSMLQYFTGSKAHNIRLREFALKKGYSLSEYGIKPLRSESSKQSYKYNENNGLFEFSNEHQFYKFLGLEYIPAEIREGTEEIKRAENKTLPKLVQKSDLKGDLHLHSLYDLKPSHDMGANTYEEMIKKAEQLGYQYIGFADHNPKVSGHIDSDIVEIMKKRKNHIDQIIRTQKVEQVKILIGLEVDILPNGELALPVEAIKYVDYLVVSVHSSFNLELREMTARVLKALSYPKVKIFGHPTARLLGKRNGIDLDWSKIFPYCREHKIALEINSSPDRLDLPDSLVYKGIKLGCKFTIDTDSHAAEHMPYVDLGVSVARRGWAQKSDIMNTEPYKQFREWIDYQS